MTSELAGPNGIAFSPDEDYLYVGDWDPKKKVVMRYQVNADATLADGRVFFDMTGAAGEDAVDGIKVDRQGNIMFPDRAVCGFSHRQANTSGRSSCLSTRITWRGEAKTARRSISRPRERFTVCH